jgi:hypothetical protein
VRIFTAIINEIEPGHYVGQLLERDMRVEGETFEETELAIKELFKWFEEFDNLSVADKPAAQEYWNLIPKSEHYGNLEGKHHVIELWRVEK